MRYDNVFLFSSLKISEKKHTSTTLGLLGTKQCMATKLKKKKKTEQRFFSLYLHRETKSLAAIGLCSKRSKTIDRNVLNVCLNRFSHLSQPIINILSATFLVASDFLVFSNDIE
jgi:hypothetical protein